MEDRIFEWDSRKSEANRKKHGIDFERVRDVFFDPLARRSIEGYEHGEIRWRTVGQIGGRLFVVSHTVEEEEGETEVIRIISARKATRGERRSYEREA